MDHVRLIPPTDLALSAEHSQALCQALAALCHEDGIELRWLSPDRWLARGPALQGVASLSLDRVSGRSIETQHLHQSAGLKRLHHEAQMLFYTQAAHDERVAQGLLPINGFWLSAAGACTHAIDPKAAQRVLDDLRTPALRERRDRLARLGELDLVPDLPMSGSGLQQLRDLRRGLGQ